ncbi:hypothetical protein Talka_01402 [Tepidimonas alkaliphilus]|uniref:Uncharacterized protein n=1 Tax=Tepidimonas alkaliphilus TaxID=2588942 RepID=A0A554W7X9_9BURK|nr:hypothetical protein Talka_01402 [Tepidimonas alkaliphilus]
MAASVWQAALLGKATARPKALAGSMQVRIERRRPSCTRSTVSTARHCSGAGRAPRGLRDLRWRRTGLGRPRRSMRAGAWRILSAAEAMMRPMVETEGSCRPCWRRQGSSNACRQGPSRDWGRACADGGFCAPGADHGGSGAPDGAGRTWPLALRGCRRPGAAFGTSDTACARTRQRHRWWPPARADPRNAGYAAFVGHPWGSSPQDAPSALPGQSPGCRIRCDEPAWPCSFVEGVPKVSELMQPLTRRTCSS